jgi:inner membrane protein
MELFDPGFWLVLGMLFLAIEIFTTGFFAFFVGLGAILTALLCYVGLIDNNTHEVLIFALSSFASLLLFRKQLMGAFKKGDADYQEFKGETAKVIETIWPGQEGKVIFRGTEWIAYADSREASLEKNSTVRIIKTDGIKLVVT